MKQETNNWKEFAPKAFQYFEATIAPQLKEDLNFYPQAANIFRAYNECSPESVKVVILGQDPYFDGSATGLAFDNNVLAVKRISPSLRNILQEIKNDVAKDPIEAFSQTSCLDHLPGQGVLLINTALTVKPNEAGSHTKMWKPFTDEIISSLQQRDNIIWILWGNHAKSFKPLITNDTHLILEGVHPMPLAANRGGFFGEKFFSKANTFLQSTNQSPINW